MILKKFLRIISPLLGLVVNEYVVMCDIYAQHYLQEKKASYIQMKGLQTEFIGGLIDKSNLKLGFLNNGRFCPPTEFLPDLPNAVFGEHDYQYRRRN